MSRVVDPEEVAGSLLVSLGLLFRRLRHAPVQGEPSLPERSALSWLERVGRATPSELARFEQISPQSMGATLAGLEARGMVARQPDPDDGRRSVMSLSESGRAALRDKRTARAEQLTHALAAGFTPRELVTLADAAPLIERLAHKIEQGG